MVAPLVALAGLATAVVAATTGPLTFGPSAFTAPGAFPTSVYKSYYNNPTQTKSQVQPIITDPVTVSPLSCYRLCWVWGMNAWG